MIPPSYLFKELYDDWFQAPNSHARRRTLFGRYSGERIESSDDEFRPARGRLRVRD